MEGYGKLKDESLRVEEESERPLGIGEKRANEGRRGERKKKRLWNMEMEQMHSSENGIMRSNEK